jgi:hypothetical protein
MSKSDLGGSVAAALAATSMVFRKQLSRNDIVFANKLLTGAEQLLEFARSGPQGYYHSAHAAATSAYRSSDYLDDLAWGCGWVFKAKRAAGKPLDNTLLEAAERYMVASETKK